MLCFHSDFFDSSFILKLLTTAFISVDATPRKKEVTFNYFQVFCLQIENNSGIRKLLEKDHKFTMERDIETNDFLNPDKVFQENHWN